MGVLLPYVQLQCAHAITKRRALWESGMESGTRDSGEVPLVQCMYRGVLRGNGAPALVPRWTAKT